MLVSFSFNNNNILSINITKKFMDKSPELNSAFQNLENQFPSQDNKANKNEEIEARINQNEKYFQEINKNMQIAPNQPNLEEENGLLSNLSAASYQNEPIRKKFLGFYVKRRLPASLLPDRKIYAGIADNNAPTNAISTSKYNIFTFWPMNLFEQFSKLANIYFLLIAILQVIPDISNTGGQPLQLVPLCFILAVSMIKDAFEDYKRHKADYEENNKNTLIYKNGNFEKTAWKDLLIGDIVKVCFLLDFFLVFIFSFI